MRARKQFPANFRSFVTLFQALSNISVRAIEIIRKHNYEIEEKKSRCVRKEKIENLHRRSSQSPKYVDYTSANQCFVLHRPICASVGCSC